MSFAGEPEIGLRPLAALTIPLPLTRMTDEEVYDALADGRRRAKEAFLAVSQGTVTRDQFKAWWSDYKQNELDPLTAFFTRRNQARDQALSVQTPRT